MRGVRLPSNRPFIAFRIPNIWHKPMRFVLECWYIGQKQVGTRRVCPHFLNAVFSFFY